MNTKIHFSFAIILVVVIVLNESGCASASATAVPPTFSPTTAPTGTMTMLPPTRTSTPTYTITPVPPTRTSTPTIIPTETPLPLAQLTLRPSDFYFSVDGNQRFILSRNITGKTQDDFKTLLAWAHQGGTTLIRIHLTAGWWGDPWINKDWSVNEKWAQDWEWFLDQAQADGIFVIPVFGVWADWNNGKPDWGGPLWQYNPLNQTNGGPVSSPSELFQSGSETQKHWMTWFKTLVERWQGRKNIAAWEIFSEINIASGAPGKTDAEGGVDEATGVDFTNTAMAIIHAADSKHRPVTLSLAGVYAPTDQWAEYYKLDSLDFIEIHPYSDTLDREFVKEIREDQAKYLKPVMIGESGLWSTATKVNALIGVQHAIWSGLVAGAMNGRALWGNDGYALYSTDDRAFAFQFLQVYATTEFPVAKFTQDVDFSGFKPLVSTSSSAVWGAAIGNDKTVIGWFRDAQSEPPDWKLAPVISKQTVTIGVPGSASSWKVDFYNTKTGTDVISSTVVTPQGNNATITLPDFNDDIALKMTSQTNITTTPIVLSPDAIAGIWAGTIVGESNNFSAHMELSIQPGCQIGRVCGKVSSAPCAGDLMWQGIEGGAFVFIEQNMTGAPTCVSGGKEVLQLQADGTLLFQFQLVPAQGTTISSTGILKRP